MTCLCAWQPLPASAFAAGRTTFHLFQFLPTYNISSSSTLPDFLAIKTSLWPSPQTKAYYALSLLQENIFAQKLKLSSQNNHRWEKKTSLMIHLWKKHHHRIVHRQERSHHQIGVRHYAIISDWQYRLQLSQIALSSTFSSNLQLLCKLSFQWSSLAAFSCQWATQPWMSNSGGIPPKIVWV
jgi:hypothetical protein